MKSWKTTVAGALGAIGTVLLTITKSPWHELGVALNALGLFLLGGAARDNNVTSEQAGAK